MTIRPIAFLLALLPLPALADVADDCPDLWFTRNLIADRAGYCFGSVLGQALFDNSGCIGKEIALTPTDEAKIARIREYERLRDCRIDTSQPRLDLYDAHIRRLLSDLPVSSGFEGACIRYRGPATPLYAGTSLSAPVIGEIRTGDNVSFAHEPVGGWSYITTYGAGTYPGTGGWTDVAFEDNTCEDYAG